MKKRFFVIILSFLILFFIIALLIMRFGKGIKKDDEMVIFTTIYPEYDFVTHIVGDKMKVLRLIEPGVEIHTYEPSSKDMVKISNADAFIYTGDVMEPWAKSIINSIEKYNVKIVDVSKNIDIINSTEFLEKYSLISEINNQDEHNHQEKDGHIWLNPQNAVIMIDNILEEIIKLDSKNKQFYTENASKYKREILDLDKEIETTLKRNNIDALVFGGEFSYSYFCQRYDIGVVSCYTACGEHQEPSINRIQEVINYIKDNNISSIFYEELSEGQVSQMLSEETKAKAKVFNTLHNITYEEINQNKDYVSIMKENLNKIIK